MQRSWRGASKQCSSINFSPSCRHLLSSTTPARAARSFSAARVCCASSADALPHEQPDQSTSAPKAPNNAGASPSSYRSPSKLPTIRRIWKGQSPHQPAGRTVKQKHNPHSDQSPTKPPTFRRIWKDQSQHDPTIPAVQRFQQQHQRARGHEFRPWLVEDSANRRARLDAEMARFAEYCRIEPQEATVRAHLLDELVEHVRAQKLDANMMVYGSESAEYALNTSPVDVDFSVDHGLTSGVEAADLEAGRRHLAPIRHQMLSQLRAILGPAIAPDWTISTLIPLNRPLLLFTHNPTNTEIQLVTNPDDTLTSRPAYEKQYMRDIPHLWPLYALLKTSLRVRNFNQTYTGGMSSYTLLMLLAAFFKHNPTLAQPSTTLHKTLLDFLIWIEPSNLLGSAISIEPLRIIPRATTIPENNTNLNLAGRKSSEAAPTLDNIREYHLHVLAARAAQGHPDRLCLQDPREARNDLGQSIPRTGSILATWSWIYSVLTKWLDTGNTRVGSVEFTSPLDVVVMNGLRDIRDRRQRLRTYYEEKLGQERKG